METKQPPQKTENETNFQAYQRGKTEVQINTRSTLTQKRTKYTMAQGDSDNNTYRAESFTYARGNTSDQLF